MADVSAIWDQPEMGLTSADFASWPSRRPFRRSDGHAAMLSVAIDQGSLKPPVYLVGECTTYDIAHGHPSFGAARHDGTFFTVSGRPGTPWAAITYMRSRGMMNRRVEVAAFTEYDHMETEEIETFPAIGYVDIQFSCSSAPVGRMGFPYFKESSARAHLQAQAVAKAILKCREGLLPNQ
jgi:hypothetical protein